MASPVTPRIFFRSSGIERRKQLFFMPEGFWAVVMIEGVAFYGVSGFVGCVISGLYKSRVEKISLLENSNRVRSTWFWGVYTKLKIFNLTNYKKVVYLEAFTNVVKSIKDLFRYGKFCANFKHSERLNTRVMVLEPSEKVFRGIMSKPVDVWQTVRGQLNVALPGTGQGSNPKTYFLVRFLFILSICLVLLWFHKSLLLTHEYGSISSSSLWGQLRHLLYKIRRNGTYAYSNVSAPSAVNFDQPFKLPNGAHMKVPEYLSGFVHSCVLCGGYLDVVYIVRAAAIQLGANSSGGSSEYDSGKGHQQHNLNFDLSARFYFYWLGMAVSAIVAPSLPCLFLDYCSFCKARLDGWRWHSVGFL
ncbi:hypothetical protein MLD38_038711 [Melastoma candidum]|uniref:Uncharacterized protein n=1 Tax=Melastoma candidum TaxID=119954 RepID=A0ACB9L0T5_9MYRT|nr:hypothetical protein MLD38_038711 [Melastoma candidum]